MALTPYVPIVILTVLALVVAGVIIALSWIAGRPRKSQTMVTPYECGVPTVGNARERFSVKFYLVAVLFILFDIEIVFLYPLAVQLEALGWFGFVEFLVFVAILAVAYVYIWRKGALEWR